MKNRKKRSKEDMIFDFVIYAILLTLSLVCVLPVWHVVMAAFSSTTDIATATGLILWPKKMSKLTK